MSALTNAVVPASTLSRSSRLSAAEPALRDDRVGGFGGDEVLVAGERRAAGADGAKQDLVLLERRRLEHHADAVGQPPLGDAEARRSLEVVATAPAVGRRASSGCVLTVST